MFDTFMSANLHSEISHKLNRREKFEDITGEIFDSQLATSLYPDGRTARTLYQECNTFLGKYDETYLRFFNLNINPKAVNGFQKHTKKQIIKAIYAKFISIPETQNIVFVFLDFVKDENSTIYDGKWSIYFVKCDSASDLLGMKDIGTGKIEFNEGIVYSVKVSKYRSSTDAARAHKSGPANSLFCTADAYSV